MNWRASVTSSLEEWVDQCTADAPVLSDFGTDVISDEVLRRWTLRHYAEVRTFIDLKLPERLRICPHDAYVAKKFFWHIYEEEQGDFVEGQNHAQMFAKFARAIGITDRDLEAEYLAYRVNFEYMREAEQSLENVVAELAISYAWESAINRIATTLTASLGDVRERFSLSDEDIEYFTAHITLDQDHARLALQTLEHYLTSPILEDIARAAIRDSLIERNPWVLPGAR
jgi:pyrroloquinoline quinone (PQQ) biosynthesis protein C